MDTIRLNKNKTTKFILPLVFNDNVKYTKVITEDLVNAYIADLEASEDENINEDNITVLYKSGNKEKLPIIEKWSADYFRILAGEYSETSEEYKEKALIFWNEDKNSLLWAILHKEKNDAIRDFWINHLQEGSTLNDLNEFYPTFQAKDEILISEQRIEE